MKSYVFLAIEAMWLIVAIVLSITGLGIHLRGMNTALMARLFRLMIPVLFLGCVWTVAAVEKITSKQPNYPLTNCVFITHELCSHKKSAGTGSPVRMRAVNLHL
jgi:predicted naringenin-chalcone synthase